MFPASHYFPADNQAAIYELPLSFALLSPILDACYDVAEGNTPTFINHFNNFKTWLINAEDQEYEEVERNGTVPQLPELDSYKFVRAGLWYQVLMKDN